MSYLDHHVPRTPKTCREGFHRCNPGIGSRSAIELLKNGSEPWASQRRDIASTATVVATCTTYASMYGNMFTFCRLGKCARLIFHEASHMISFQGKIKLKPVLLRFWWGYVSSSPLSHQHPHGASAPTLRRIHPLDLTESWDQHGIWLVYKNT